MTDIAQRIIQAIRRNRISTPEVSDCLGKTGAIKGVTALNSGHFQVGPLRYVYAYNRSNWELHEQLEQVQPGEIVLVEAIECEDYALFGALAAKFCLLYSGVAAMVVKGLVRDAHILRKDNYPIWCQGVTPVGCFNHKNASLPSADHLQRLRDPYEGGIAVCDDSGVVVIPRDRLQEDFLEKLRLIELQEDAWFHSIDTDHYTTYQAVCLKKYLDEGSVFHKYDELKETL